MAAELSCRRVQQIASDLIFKQPKTVIASVSEAIHRAAKKEWIASSLRSSQ
jgi:hypothetical protein